MDTVGPAPRQEVLRKFVEEAQTALREAADASVVKNDPLCQHLNVLALSIGAHFVINCATEETQSVLARSIKTPTDTVTKGIESSAKVGSGKIWLGIVVFLYVCGCFGNLLEHLRLDLDAIILSAPLHVAN